MRTRAFSLIELLVVIAILCLVAALLFPVFAQARRSACVASTTERLRQLGAATHLYQADHEGHLPIDNFASWEPWQLFPRIDPLGPYGAKGYDANGDPLPDSPMFSACGGGPFVYRWVFGIAENSRDEAEAREVRRVEPHPTSVLVRCPNFLSRGYQYSKNSRTLAYQPQDREGRELLLRGDGSVDNIDTKAIRFTRRVSENGKDQWQDTPPGGIGDFSKVPGQEFQVFPNEFWPPEWTPVRWPAQEKR